MLDAFLGFVMFDVVCVSRGPNVDLAAGKAVDTQEFKLSGKIAYYHENDFESRKTNLLMHTLSKALIHVVFFFICFGRPEVGFFLLCFVSLGHFFRIT